MIKQLLDNYYNNQYIAKKSFKNYIFMCFGRIADLLSTYLIFSIIKSDNILELNVISNFFINNDFKYLIVFNIFVIADLGILSIFIQKNNLRWWKIFQIIGIGSFVFSIINFIQLIIFIYLC